MQESETEAKNHY